MLEQIDPTTWIEATKRYGQFSTRYTVLQLDIPQLEISRNMLEGIRATDMRDPRLKELLTKAEIGYEATRTNILDEANKFLDLINRYRQETPPSLVKGLEGELRIMETLCKQAIDLTAKK